MFSVTKQNKIVVLEESNTVLLIHHNYLNVNSLVMFLKEMLIFIQVGLSVLTS